LKKKTLFVLFQFDILWDALTAKEHLELFASIKGLPQATIKSVYSSSYDFSLKLSWICVLSFLGGSLIVGGRAIINTSEAQPGS
jgi:hypothetical protein